MYCARHFGFVFLLLEILTSSVVLAEETTLPTRAVNGTSPPQSSAVGRKIGRKCGKHPNSPGTIHCVLCSTNDASNFCDLSRRLFTKCRADEQGARCFISRGGEGLPDNATFKGCEEPTKKQYTLNKWEKYEDGSQRYYCKTDCCNEEDIPIPTRGSAITNRPAVSALVTTAVLIVLGYHS